MNTQQLKELALVWSRSAVACMPIEEFSDLTGTPLEDARTLFGAADALNDLIEQLEAAERERDELRGEFDKIKILSRKRLSNACKAFARAEVAEAEIARRDAAAGEASDRIVDDGDGQQTGGIGVSDRLNCLWPIGTKFYTAAQPAVLPPDITFESKGFISLTSEDFAYNRALEDARKLGAQPQKPVICPPVQYLSKYAADDGHCTTGKLVPNKRTELRDTEWREALDAAGVKWEVKK